MNNNVNVNVKVGRSLIVGIVVGIALCITSSSPLSAQPSDAWNLARNHSPASTTCFWAQSGPGVRAQCVTLADILLNTVPTTDPRLPSYNVKSSPYLAVGDGAADDTASIQSAVNAACSAGGGVVYAPFGVYNLSLAITVPCSRVSVEGDAPSFTRFNLTSATANGFVFGSGGTPVTPCGGLRDLSISSSIARTAGTALVIDGCAEGIVSNVKFFMANGGNGIDIGATPAANSSLWWFYNLNMTITKAFTAIAVRSGNDRHFIGGWIQGDGITAGSTGIKFLGSGGDWIVGVDVVLFDVGALIAPTAGNTVSWVDAHNLLTDNNLSVGLKIASAGGTVYGIRLSDSWAGSNGLSSATGYGILIDGSGGGSTGNVSLSNVESINNGAHGIYLKSTGGVGIVGGSVTANSNAASNTYDGIRLESATDVVVAGVKSGNLTGGNNHQKYGINADSASTYTVVGNDLCGNSTAGANFADALAATKKRFGNVCDATDIASTTAAGLVQLATSGATTAGLAVQASDTRLAGQFTAIARVNANAASLPAPATGTLLHIGNADATPARITVDGFGAASVPGTTLRRSGGTAASPSAITAAAQLGNHDFGAYDGSVWTGVGAETGAEAGENWTTSAHGGNWFVSTADTLTLNLTRKLVVDMNGHLLLQSPTAPAIACTGTGTSPSAPTITGTDQRFIVTMSTGTGSPGSTGTCTVTFAKSYAAAVPLVCTLVKGATAWGNGATVQVTTESASAPVLTWANLVGGVATGLTVSTSYKFYCLAIG